MRQWQSGLLAFAAAAVLVALALFIGRGVGRKLDDIGAREAEVRRERIAAEAAVDALRPGDAWPTNVAYDVVERWPGGEKRRVCLGLYQDWFITMDNSNRVHSTWADR